MYAAMDTLDLLLAEDLGMQAADFQDVRNLTAASTETSYTHFGLRTR